MASKEVVRIILSLIIRDTKIQNADLISQNLLQMYFLCQNNMKYTWSIFEVCFKYTWSILQIYFGSILPVYLKYN